MKLSNEVVLEIVAIVQNGLLGIKDASEALRELDLTTDNADDLPTDTLLLSPEYLESHPRANVWEDEPNAENN